MRRVKRLTRSNSTVNLTQQLGARGRPRLRRNNLISGRAQSRGRSQSRNRNAQQANAQAPVARGRSASQSRAPIRLKRSNSRLNVGAATAPKRISQRQRSRSRSNVQRKPSVNARLGIAAGRGGLNTNRINRQGNRNNQNNGIQRGRITRRPNMANTRKQLGKGIQRQQQQQQSQRVRSRSR